MDKPITDIEKGKRGRPRTDSTPVLVRLQPELLAKLDEWRDGLEDQPGRPEAVRRAIIRAVE